MLLIPSSNINNYISILSLKFPLLAMYYRSHMNVPILAERLVLPYPDPTLDGSADIAQSTILSASWNPIVLNELSADAVIFFREKSLSAAPVRGWVRCECNEPVNTVFVKAAVRLPDTLRRVYRIPACFTTCLQTTPRGNGRRVKSPRALNYKLLRGVRS